MGGVGGGGARVWSCAGFVGSRRRLGRTPTHCVCDEPRALARVLLARVLLARVLLARVAECA